MVIDWINGVRTPDEIRSALPPSVISKETAALRKTVAKRARQIIKSLGEEPRLEAQRFAVARARNTLSNLPKAPPEYEGLTSENFAERMAALDARKSKLSRKLGRLVLESELGPRGPAYDPAKQKQLRTAIAKHAGLSGERQVRRVESTPHPREGFLCDRGDSARRERDESVRIVRILLKLRLGRGPSEEELEEEIRSLAMRGLLYSLASDLSNRPT